MDLLKRPPQEEDLWGWDPPSLCRSASGLWPQHPQVRSRSDPDCFTTNTRVMSKSCNHMNTKHDEPAEHQHCLSRRVSEWHETEEQHWSSAGSSSVLHIHINHSVLSASQEESLTSWRLRRPPQRPAALGSGWSVQNTNPFYLFYNEKKIQSYRNGQ